ncbi:MAG: glycogen-binding domain-containing protein [Gemmatimonadota bacterium]|nr:glycogen-binding domain-containing protein [Gemmatimonadota bacterium]
MRLRIALGALLACGLPLQAQEASAVIGGSHVRYADSLAGNAGFVSARLGVGRGLGGAQLDAAVSRFTDGGWALQVAGQGTILWSLGAGPWLAGVAAGAALNAVEAGPISGTGAAGPIVAVRTSRTQVVAGVSAGGFRTIDGLWAGLFSGSLRWYWAASSRITLDIGGSATGADTLRFVDFSAQWRLATGPMRTGILGGARVGDLTDGPWGSVDIALDVGGPVTVEASAGRYPRDVTGFTDGLYAQVGVRLFAARAPTPARMPPAAVDVRRLDARRVRITLRYAAPVSQLQIAGDWNAWIPAPLARRGSNTWVVDLDIPAGAHTYALVVDDTWVLPDGVTGVEDGFGGRVGILMVP